MGNNLIMIMRKQ